MFTSRRIRALTTVFLVLGVMLAYWGAMGIFVVPGIHAFGAKVDFATVADPADTRALAAHIAGGDAALLSEKSLEKLAAQKDIVALSRAIPAYIAAYQEIQARIDTEFGNKLSELQAQIDPVNAKKKELQKQLVAARRLVTEGQTSDEVTRIEAQLAETRAEYDALTAQKDALNAEKANVKASSAANDSTIRETAGFAEMAVARETGKAGFSTVLDSIAHTRKALLLALGALLILLSAAAKLIFREKRESGLPLEFRAASGAKPNWNLEKKKFDAQSLLAPAALVILFLFFALKSESFRSAYTMKTILENSYYIGFLAFGVTFVIMTGGIDLSLGTNMICSALIGCYAYSTWGWPLWLAIWLVPLIAMGFGFINGVMVAKLKLPPFIATLGTQMITMGFGQIVTGVTTQYYPTIGNANTWFKTATYRAGAFPIGVCYLAAAFLIAVFLLNRTKFGRYTLAIGSNEEAARLSGVNTDRWKIAVYAVCGLFVGFAGLFYAAVNTVIIPGYGSGQELNGIAAVVIGGTSMSGGSGTIVGTIIGVFIMSVLKSGLSSVGLQSHWQTFFTGFVVIGAVLLDQWRTASARKVKAKTGDRRPRFPGLAGKKAKN